MALSSPLYPYKDGTMTSLSSRKHLYKEENTASLSSRLDPSKEENIPFLSSRMHPCKEENMSFLSTRLHPSISQFHPCKQEDKTSLSSGLHPSKEENIASLTNRLHLFEEEHEENIASVPSRLHPSQEEILGSASSPVHSSKEENLVSLLSRLHPSKIENSSSLSCNLHLSKPYLGIDQQTSTEVTPTLENQNDTMEDEEASVYERIWLGGLGILDPSRKKQFGGNQDKDNEQQEDEEKAALYTIAVESCLANKKVIKMLGNPIEAASFVDVDEVQFSDYHGNRRIQMIFGLDGAKRKGTVDYLAEKDTTGRMKTILIKIKTENRWRKKVVVEDNRTLNKCIRDIFNFTTCTL